MRVFHMRDEMYVITDDELSEADLRREARRLESPASRILHFDMTGGKFRKSIRR